MGIQNSKPRRTQRITKENWNPPEFGCSKNRERGCPHYIFTAITSWRWAGLVHWDRPRLKSAAKSSRQPGQPARSFHRRDKKERQRFAEGGSEPSTWEQTASPPKPG